MNTQIKIFHLIDALLKWEGQFCSTDLMQTFNITRSTAQKWIKKYNEQYPQNFKYSNSSKTHQATEEFIAQSWNGTFRDYRLLFSHPQTNNLTDLDIICDLNNCTNSESLRLLNFASRKRLILEVDYGSLSSPNDFEGRLIAPHSIVMDGLRVHVRAYCFKNNEYRDFIVGRFRSVPEIEEGDLVGIGREFDDKWNTNLNLKIIVDPSLSEAQKQNLQMEYQMIEGYRIITTPIALLPYVMKRLRLDSRQQIPEAQQLIIDPLCYKSIKKYLPS